MRNYRLYLLDEDNDVLEVREIVCSEDDAAIEQAEAVTDQRMELWQGGRLVKSWRPVP